jgi:hypothetical protein
MIKFELAHPDGCNAEDAVVYIPGQDYVMFNGIQWHLERALENVDESWVGCVFDTSTISFIQQSGLIVHSANIAVEPEAVVLLRAAKRASEAIQDVVRLMHRIPWAVQKRRSFEGMRNTLRMIEKHEKLGKRQKR